MIFPRYHQWDVVRKLLETSRAEGPGHKYLIQHSAGSGKSNSIAWTAHQLSSLYTAKGEKQFHSVIVVTDRTVLDDQLQETIYQFEHTDGVVGRINREEGEGSKSEKLAAALEGAQPIIIVTIQTFPFVLRAIENSVSLPTRWNISRPEPCATRMPTAATLSSPPCSISIRGIGSPCTFRWKTPAFLAGATATSARACMTERSGRSNARFQPGGRQYGATTPIRHTTNSRPS